MEMLGPSTRARRWKKALERGCGEVPSACLRQSPQVQVVISIRNTRKSSLDSRGEPLWEEHGMYVRGRVRVGFVDICEG